jgi:hypothetical protein
VDTHSEDRSSQQGSGYGSRAFDVIEPRQN